MTKKKPQEIKLQMINYSVTTLMAEAAEEENNNNFVVLTGTDAQELFRSDTRG